ncbi:alpha/beta fold hydrolase [Paenarthrobacter ilicis]|uniref:Pimeloyl-ACP methyl ester carboxylesterase n=1 Tax=Paenarthrobacter ilicis TaxID=43665 RepID=A0ABX0TQI6_9MICC|nr:alpha/beta hydrolase [Paenarthrobacter ilicis]MBM7794679.1 pimeloyl-ACP methyl ester carboxylesterase [Paenarthrobacter ilicis]NIJ03475.1 pimeloyl-ACP methyl ester carboxylesterase [Paenarthrobacter ilicis]
MALTLLPDATYHRVPVAPDIHLNVAVAGSGPAVVLLHGFPQTHLMWRHVADDLAKDHTVICPDLRGYGASDKPAEEDEATYSKRTMAADVVTAARFLGHEQFALAGHDRGALVAVRAGLDHPKTVTHLLALEVLPTLDMWEILRGADAKVAWHLYLMAQAAGIPEPMIEATADSFFASFLDGWTNNPEAISADYRQEYLRASREAVWSIVADYRASAGIDITRDRADRNAGRTLAMPVAVMQQDWGTALGYDAASLWGAWAPALEHMTLDIGHFMAEENPVAVIAAMRELMDR